jgi:adenylylsulfate kinase
VDGHYRLADTGEIAMFPGVSAPYESPPQPDLVLHTDRQSVDECVDAILALLEQRGVFQ